MSLAEGLGVRSRSNFQGSLIIGTLRGSSRKGAALCSNSITTSEGVREGTRWRS